MAQCKELVALDDVQVDLACMVCLEPLHEGRRFECFHLLCSHCATKHVEACLHQSDDVKLPFGPVFCPQCRELTYVFSEEGFGLPVCESVALARQESHRLRLHVEGAEQAGGGHDDKLQTVAMEIEKELSETMAQVRKLINEERQCRESIYEWAGDEELIDTALICNRNGGEKLNRALSVLKEQFEDVVHDLMEKRLEVTNKVENLFLRKWVLQSLRQSGNVSEKMADEWFWWIEHMPEDKEPESKEDMESDDDITPEETFLLSAIFKMHRPYPGAVLPENRVKAGAISAELIWSVGQRGSGPDEFNWPIHAAFIGNGERIAVADKNNLRVVIMDTSDGQAKEHLFKGQIKPRRVYSQGSDPGYLYISDEISATVKVFEMDTWQQVNKFGHGLFLCPTGVSQKRDGSLVYSDMDRGFICVHDNTTYAIKTKFTARLLGDIYLPSPSYVAVDSDDYFIVSDSQNNCIKIFNNRGGVVSRFGSDVLSCPRGIVVDPLGLIFVVDSDNHTIRVFDPFGKFVQTLELPGTKLHYPMSLDYMPQERLLLVSQCSFLYHDHSVSLFRLDFQGGAVKMEIKEESEMI